MEIAAHTPGSFCTSVLRTKDMERAVAFYRALGAWTFQDVTPGHRLMLFGGKAVASLHQISEGPDLWVPHASVENIERTTAEALALGATLVDTADVPGLASLSALRDLEGAVFGLWQPAPHPGAQLIFVHTVPKTGRIGSLRDPGGAAFVIRGPIR